MRAVVGILVILVSVAILVEAAPGRREKKAKPSRCPYGSRVRQNTNSFIKLVKDRELQFVGCQVKNRRGRPYSMVCSASCGDAAILFAGVDPATYDPAYVITTECTLKGRKKKYRSWSQHYQTVANGFATAYCEDR